ncbi:MAG TPA: hypothetical protein VF114_08300 [Candidatus Limnocylindria bacterium]
MEAIGYRQYINRNLPVQERGCTSKAVYVSRREAKSIARHGRRGYAGLHPYRCRWCDGWHLGHRRGPH